MRLGCLAQYSKTEMTKNTGQPCSQLNTTTRILCGFFRFHVNIEFPKPEWKDRYGGYHVYMLNVTDSTVDNILRLQCLFNHDKNVFTA